MSLKDQLLAKIENHQATVAVIGLGYVGLPLAVAFAERGFPVVGIDVDDRKVGMLAAGESYIQDVPSQRLARLRLQGAIPAAGTVSPSFPLAESGFFATTDYAVLDRCDVAVICVPTPLNKTRDPDVRYLISAGESVARHIHPGMLVVLESTTYPGTTEELLLPMLVAGLRKEEIKVPSALTTPAPSRTHAVASSGSPVGTEFFLAFSPERIDPGNKQYVVENTPKVVGGITPACRQVTEALYAQIIERIVPVSSTRTAEMVKLLENTFRAVNIALVNEVAIMCDKLQVDVWEVIEAAATKPYGFMKFSPGPGVGGHCIPLDPHYLSWKLKTLNYNARFIQLAGEINTEMPQYWVDKVQDALNEVGKALRGSRILVLGVAYKKDIDDVRESPALDIMELLRLKGAEVTYHDPHVQSFTRDGESLFSVADLDAALAAADCVVIVTDHSAYNFRDVYRRASMVVDTRHVSR